MSYNTRRTGGAIGRGQTTQVNYHQQPSRPGGNVTQQTRNPGYTTTPSANYNTASQPAYSTQQPGYTTAPPMPAQAPAPPPPPQPQQPQTPAQPPLPSQQQPSTPSLKQEPVTPANTPKMDTSTSENGDASQSKPFWRKKPFVKLSNKVRRARMNAKLRRVLNPKNALTFLNELRPGGVKFAVREETGWGFIASVDIDGKTFSGNGMTVSKAKVQASEQALRHILMEQMAKSQIAGAADGGGDSAADTDKDEAKRETDEEMTLEGTEGDDGEEPKKKRARTELAEDEMPWGSLAAFALHKLFEEWQKDAALPLSGPTQEKYDEDMGDDSYYRRPGPADFGYPRRFPPGPGMFGRGRGFGPFPGRGAGFNGPRRLPLPPAMTFLGIPPRPAVPLGNTTLNSGILPMKKIPEDANKRHPVMLLNQLKPNLVYNETREGEAPHVMFKISVEINGQEYVGRGKSKKEAKKMAAKAALAPMGIAYED